MNASSISFRISQRGRRALHFNDNWGILAPSTEGETFVDVSASVAAKVLQLNRLVSTNISNAELARMINMRPQEIQLIVSPGHSTKIDTIQKALSALGQQMEIVVR